MLEKWNAWMHGSRCTEGDMRSMSLGPGMKGYHSNCESTYFTTTDSCVSSVIIRSGLLGKPSTMDMIEKQTLTNNGS